MFAELDLLVHGQGDDPGDVDVTKAQLPGPCALRQWHDLPDATDVLVAAVARLTDLHPRLNELWLDEPIIDDPAQLAGVAGRLAEQFPSLRIGLHTCGSALPDPLVVPTLRVVHADLWRGPTTDDTLRAWLRAGAEVVLGVVPTTERPDPHAVLARALALAAVVEDIACTSVIRVAPTCGAGALSADDARNLFERLERLRIELGAALDKPHAASQ